jgi:hypothetical protein
VRTICGLAGLAAAGFLAASAYGIGIPTVSTPTVTAPSLSVPSVPLPSLPKPTLPAPTAPAPMPPPAPVPQPTVHVPTATAPSSAPTPSGSSAAPAPAPSSAPAPSTAAAPARSYGIAGSSHATRRQSARAQLPGLRRVIARFTLAHPARIRISIEQLAPVCRTLRSYLVKLPKGAHAFRFPLNRATDIGTYRVTATLRDRKLFSVRARRLHKRVRLGGTADVCAQLRSSTAFSLAAPSTLLGAGSPSARSHLHVKSAHAQREAAPPATGAQPRQRNPLIRAISVTDAPPSLQPLLYTLLAIAIFLLALAAAPQQVLPAGRAAAIVAMRRGYLAAAGIWLLIVVAVVTAFA